MSRATLVDLPPEPEGTDPVDNEATEILQPEQDTAMPESEEGFAEQPQESVIPEKYRNKSLEEVVQMHQEAEKLLGRQSSEVGELRKVVDDYIASQTQPSAPQQNVEPEDELDFFTDPQATVNRAIENHPSVKEAAQYSVQYRQQAALAELERKHPDMKNILSDQSFGSWVEESPIRKRLFVEADQEFSVEAADELFSLWKGLRGAAQQTAAADKQSRKQQIKAANTGSAQGSSERSPKKVYRRADLIKLMKDQPDRYQALSEEILKAYAERRVR